MTSLQDIPPGGRGRIVGVGGDAEMMQRLLEMGLTPGTELEVVRLAPLGDPIEVRVRGYLLSIRKENAGLIRMEPQP
jgi:Fe2+ transport system protein FeoA